MPTFKPEKLRLLLKQEFLTVPELEWVLFGPEHPSLQENENHRIKIENALDTIEQFINDAVSTEKLIASPEKIQRRLFLNKPPVALPVNHWGYEIVSLLRLLQEKEYPISKKLIQSIKNNDWDTAINKVKTLPKEMIKVIETGCFSARVAKVTPAPQGTRWGDVTITLVSNDTVKVSIKDLTKRLHFSEMNFSDKRKGDSPTMLWKLLIILIKNQGELSPAGEEFKRNLVSSASRLNIHMKELFGISQEIYCGHYKTNNKYKVAFQVSDQTYGTAEDL